MKKKPDNLDIPEINKVAELIFWFVYEKFQKIDELDKKINDLEEKLEFFMRNR